MLWNDIGRGHKRHLHSWALPYLNWMNVSLRIGYWVKICSQTTLERPPQRERVHLPWRNVDRCPSTQHSEFVSPNT